MIWYCSLFELYRFSSADKRSKMKRNQLANFWCLVVFKNRKKQSHLDSISVVTIPLRVLSRLDSCSIGNFAIYLNEIEMSIHDLVLFVV